jgi:predicted ABC-type ATPase
MANPWVTYITNRIKSNRNFLCLITGPTGSGKSVSALSICEQLDKGFNADRIVFRIDKLMSLINSQTLKPGACILFDEAGVEFSNRNWQSTINKTLSILIQTCRSQKFILFLTVPYSDFVDTSVRKLFHAEFLTQSIDRKWNECVIKPQIMQYNSRKKKTYYKALRRPVIGGGLTKINTWGVGLPSKTLLDQYENVKQQWIEEKYKALEKEIAGLEKTEVPLTEKQETALKLMNKYNDVERVAIEMGMTNDGVYNHLAQCKKKGYIVHRAKSPTEKSNE